MNTGAIVLIYIILLIIVYMICFYGIELTSAVSFMIASIVGLISLFIFAQFIECDKISLITFGIIAFIASFILLTSVAVVLSYTTNNKKNNNP